jgi:hypothetical protein
VARQGGRLDEYNVTVSVDGRDLGTWDKFSGGEVDSEETRFKPGNMRPSISLGGSVNIGNVTVSRLYDLEKVHAVTHWLIDRVGEAIVVVKKQPLDRYREPFGNPLVYRGVLKQINPPEHDSESSDAALLELEMVPQGSVT